jgi:hypothetical protein
LLKVILGPASVALVSGFACRITRAVMTLLMLAIGAGWSLLDCHTPLAWGPR